MAVTTAPADRAAADPARAVGLPRAGARLEELPAYQLRALRATVAREGAQSFYAERLRDVEPGDLRSFDDLAGLPLTTADDSARTACASSASSPATSTASSPCRRRAPPASPNASTSRRRTRSSRSTSSITACRCWSARATCADPAPRGAAGQRRRPAAPRARADGRGGRRSRSGRRPRRALRCSGRAGSTAWSAFRCRCSGWRAATRRPARPSTSRASCSVPTRLPALWWRPSSRWGCRVFDHYGTTEMGLGGGVECEALDGYHLREADLLFEVADPETGRLCPTASTVRSSSPR